MGAEVHDMMARVAKIKSSKLRDEVRHMADALTLAERMFGQLALSKGYRSILCSLESIAERLRSTLDTLEHTPENRVVIAHLAALRTRVTDTWEHASRAQLSLILDHSSSVSTEKRLIVIEMYQRSAQALDACVDEFVACVMGGGQGEVA